VAYIALAMGAACAVMALASSAFTLAVGFAALRGATIGGLSLVSQHVINQWFVGRRGMAATAASIGVALGGVVFPQVIEALLKGGGWRRAYLTLGAVVGATMLVVGVSLFRDRPERFGLLPDFGVWVLRSDAPAEPVFTRAGALRTPVFWTLSLANVLVNGLGTGLLLNHFDLLARGGLSREIGVVVFAPLAITQVAAAVAIGPLVDRFVPHRLISLSMAATTVACVLVAMVASPSGAVVYGVAVGFAYGSFQAVNAAVYAHYYGRKHAGEIRGITFVVTIVGAALGPVAFGWSTAHGSYEPVLMAGAVLCVVSALANLAVHQPPPPQIRRSTTL
jgi:MFS family permease